MKRAPAARVIALIAAMAAAVLWPSVNPANAETVSVSANDFFFSPTPRTITVGDTVQWTNTSSTFVHNVTLVSGSENLGDINPTQSVSKTFAVAGTFTYFCRFHGLPTGQGMFGTIVVQPASTTSSSTTSTSTSTSTSSTTVTSTSTTSTTVGPPMCDGKLATIVGTAGGDTIVGTSGDDVIAGRGGGDSIQGGGGNDTICGDDGFDLIDGGDGNDRVFGGPGNDRLLGGTGANNVFGEAGVDQCFVTPTSTAQTCEHVLPQP